MIGKNPRSRENEYGKSSFLQHQVVAMSDNSSVDTGAIIRGGDRKARAIFSINSKRGNIVSGTLLLMTFPCAERRTDRQIDRQPLFRHDKLKSCAACGVVRKY